MKKYCYMLCWYVLVWSLLHRSEETCFRSSAIVFNVFEIGKISLFRILVCHWNKRYDFGSNKNSFFTPETEIDAQFTLTVNIRVIITIMNQIMKDNHTEIVLKQTL